MTGIFSSCRRATQGNNIHHCLGAIPTSPLLLPIPGVCVCERHHRIDQREGRAGISPPWYCAALNEKIITALQTAVLGPPVLCASCTMPSCTLYPHAPCALVHSVPSCTTIPSCPPVLCPPVVCHRALLYCALLYCALLAPTPDCAFLALL